LELKVLSLNVLILFIVQYLIAREETCLQSGVVSIIHSHEYLRENSAKTYWKISPYYLSQPTDSSCSVAAATMVLNAARSPQMLYANQKFISGTKSVGHFAPVGAYNAKAPIALALFHFGKFYYLITSVMFGNVQSLICSSQKTIWVF
jgi:hypothetical protein